MEYSNTYMPNSKVRFRIVLADEERQPINDSDDDQIEEEKDLRSSPGCIFVQSIGRVFKEILLLFGLLIFKIQKF